METRAAHNTGESFLGSHYWFATTKRNEAFNFLRPKRLVTLVKTTLVLWDASGALDIDGTNKRGVVIMAIILILVQELGNVGT